MFTRLHQTNFCGEGSSGSPCEQQACDNWTQLAHQRQVDNQAQRLGGAINHQRVIHLQRQHKAHRQTGRQNDQQRAVAHGMDLGHNEVGAAQSRAGGLEEAPEKQRSVPQRAQQVEGALAYTGHKTQSDFHYAIAPNSSTTDLAG